MRERRKGEREGKKRALITSEGQKVLDSLSKGVKEMMRAIQFECHPDSASRGEKGAESLYLI